MKTKSNRNILIATLLLIAGFVSMSCASNREPSILKTFSTGDVKFLSVSSTSGGIKVMGHDENEIAVKVFVEKNGWLLSPDDELVQRLDEGYDLSIQLEENELIVKAKRTSTSEMWKKLSVSFQIELPKNVTSNLHTSGGGITIVNLSGEQKLNTSGGGINLVGISGSVIGETSGGGIKIEDSQGDVNVTTSGGGITIANTNGNIKAFTSGGGIKLDHVNGNVNVGTSGGQISLNGEMKNVVARTSGGGIQATITGLTEKLHLETSGGGIHASIPSQLGMDLNLHGDHVNMQLENFSGTSKQNKIVGSMNGGGIPVYMSTSGGGINVDFQ